MDCPALSPIDCLFDIEALKKCVVDYCDSHGFGISHDNRGNLFERRQTVRRVSCKLPMALPLRRDTFYIRECFPVYYDLLLASFASGLFDFLSVTGTPGIGKSVFYIYFFERYREEHPDQTIVTASWDITRDIIDCIVYRPAKEPEPHGKVIPDLDGAIYLYDGPPSSYPVRSRMVCFTSPNQSWFRSVKKNSNHSPIFFPTWSLSELQEAKIACRIEISDDVLLDRYKFFGGSASLFDYVVAPARRDLETRLGDIVSFDTLLYCLKQTYISQDIVSHQIFHSVPIISPGLPFVFMDQKMLCSDEVTALIYDNIKEESDKEMRKFTRFLKANASYCSPLLGVMFEEYCRRCFTESGLVASALPLTQPGNVLSLGIRSGEYKHMPRNCESIDGIHEESPDKIINMFQITVTSDHPVSSHGILRQLAAENNLDAYMDSKLCVRLIFVIPDGVEHDFKAQKITTQNISTQTALVSIPWLSRSCKRSLASQGIKTAGQLIAAAPTNEFIQRLEGECSVLTLIKGHIRDSQLNRTVKIPQFYIVKSGFFD